MLKDPLEAEDVAQETFIRVWKAADRFEKARPGVDLDQPDRHQSVLRPAAQAS